MKPRKHKPKPKQAHCDHCNKFTLKSELIKLKAPGGYIEVCSGCFEGNK